MKKNIVLIQPQSGSYDHVVIDPPLGLIYAATAARMQGYAIRLLDCRLHRNWQEECVKMIDQNTVLVGISVMSGRPIYYAREVSIFIKRKYGVPVLWGGAHPTLDPDNVLKAFYVDYICRGDGSQALAALADAVSNGRETEIVHIPNISFKKNGVMHHNEIIKMRSLIAWKDIPFDLITTFSYHRFNAKERIFPILTSMGCPHQCRFCYLSASSMKQKWLAYAPAETIELFQYIINKFKANCLSVIDNDFFVDLDRVRDIFKMIVEKKWDVTFGFRGVRIDELDRMDDELLALMEIAKVQHLHIGVESGSQRMLDYYHKRTTVEQIVRVNKRLSAFSHLLPSYNFFSGAPTETTEEITRSIDLVKRLVEDNPFCQISSFNQYVPYPGGDLSQEAVRHGFIPPRTLEEWATFDDTEVARTKIPWLTAGHKRLLFIAYAVGIFVDRKIPQHFTQKNIAHKMYRLGWRIMHSITHIRLKYSFYYFPVEYYLLRTFYHCIESMNIVRYWIRSIFSAAYHMLKPHINKGIWDP